MFEWDEGNADHIAWHNITPDEAEEAFMDPRRMGAPAYNVAGEGRRAVLGATESGRVLYIVFVRRGEAVRIITARDATRTERRRYRR